MDASNQKALSSKESTTEHSKILCNLQEQPPAPDISIQSLGEPFWLSLLYIIIAEICITIDKWLALPKLSDEEVRQTTNNLNQDNQK